VDAWGFPEESAASGLLGRDRLGERDPPKSALEGQIAFKLSDIAAAC
jgi:hypothetical protein